MIPLHGCASDRPAGSNDGRADIPSGEVDLTTFLDDYGRRFGELSRVASEADWALNTRIRPGDTTLASRSERARLELARFVGDAATVRRVRAALGRSDIGDLERRQLEAMLRLAAPYPATIPHVVARRVALENRQIQTLFGFEFRLAGEPVSTSQLDRILRTSRDERLRRAAWEASKEVGVALRSGVLPLRDLRNRTVRELGFEDFADFKVRGYGLDRAELLDLTDRLIDDAWPLYRELHTWARHELAARYDAPVPEYLPAHWLPDRWGSDWSPLIESRRARLDDALADREPGWLVREAEAFYRSLGFERLPGSFWTRSSLYPLPPGAGYSKNDHASAWHIDLERDVRALMSVEADARWYETTHHELGHIYYYLAYGRSEVPVVLRAGANRALHEAIGSLLGMAALQDRFLAGRGLLPASGRPAPDVESLLREALRFVVFVPWSAGVMTRYEDELYRGEVGPHDMNARWWELVRRYQGIVPPAPRDETAADAATKTHLTNDPAEYYDYAIAHAILFQLHGRIASEILAQDPHDTDYYGSRAVGDFLRPMLAAGATRPWQRLIEEATGSPLDGDAMAAYFAPLLTWLQAENRGRRHTLPPRPGG